MDDQYRKGRQDTKREFFNKIETKEFWGVVLAEDGPEGAVHVAKVKEALAKATKEEEVSAASKPAWNPRIEALFNHTCDHEVSLAEFIDAVEEIK